MFLCYVWGKLTRWLNGRRCIRRMMVMVNGGGIGRGKPCNMRWSCAVVQWQNNPDDIPGDQTGPKALIRNSFLMPFGLSWLVRPRLGLRAPGSDSIAQQKAPAALCRLAYFLPFRLHLKLYLYN